MRRIQMLAADERGLIGKILILWIVLGVVFLVLVSDAARIGLSRYHVADAAQSAAYEAASTLVSTRGDRGAAYAAAVTVVEDEGVRLVEFVIDPQTGAVTVTVSAKASTLLVGRLGFLKGLTKAKSTETSTTTTAP